MALVLFVPGLCGASGARAMDAPDSAAFARLARMAGPQGRARLRVRSQQEWFVVSGGSWDSTGVHAGRLERETRGMSSVWSEASARHDLAWAELERVQVPSRRSPIPAAVLGVMIGAAVGTIGLATAGSDRHLSTAQRVSVLFMCAMVGGAEGLLGASFWPFHKPDWVEL